MRSSAYLATAIAMLAHYGGESAHAQIRAKADVTCEPGAERLQYDCVVKLSQLPHE